MSSWIPRVSSSTVVNWSVPLTVSAVRFVEVVLVVRQVALDPFPCLINNERESWRGVRVMAVVCAAIGSLVGRPSHVPVVVSDHAIRYHVIVNRCVRSW